MEGQPISLALTSPQWFLWSSSLEMAQPLQLQSYPSPKTPEGASTELQQQNMGWRGS